MDTNTIADKLKKLTNKRLKLYTSLLRQELLTCGFDQKIVDQALKKTIQILKKRSTFDADCRRIIEISSIPQEKRGIDPIGRILVEYCFFRAPTVQMVWPENSEKDQLARETFVEGVIPRPLMSYFLVSVRGTMPELNKFEASSVLFGKENVSHEERKKQVSQLVEEYGKTISSPQKKWDTIYSDPIFQKAALDLIRDIRRKILHFGLDRYLRILENLRQRDPANKGPLCMRRPFILDDIKQLDDSLWNAEEYLSKLLKP